MKRHATEPSFTNHETEAINANLNVRFYFGPHKNGDDALPIAPLIADADIVVPEFGGWNDRALQAANIYAATRETKANMPSSDRELGQEFAQHIHQSGGFAKALYRPLRNSGKEIAFTDMRLDHPSFDQLYGSAGDNYFGSSVLKGATTGDFDKDIKVYDSNFSEVSPMIRERELEIRSNLHQLLARRALENRSHESETTSILSILGAGHSGTVAWLESNGINIGIAPESDLKIDMYVSMVQEAMEGRRPDRITLSRALLSGIFSGAAENHLEELSQTSRATAKLSKTAIARYSAENMGIEDMKYIWEGSESQLGIRFNEVKDKKGLQYHDH
jgi:hypothetical protein